MLLERGWAGSVWLLDTLELYLLDERASVYLSV